MNRNFIAMTVVLVLLATGCHKENPPSAQAGQTPDNAGASNFGIRFIQEWVQAPSPTPMLRNCAFSFTIGSKGYMGGGGGYLPTARGANPNYSGTLGDFWEFDPASNSWTQKANLLYELERAATFVIGTQGYVGTGSHEVYNYGTGSWDLALTVNRLYQYDQASNTWTRKADLPGNTIGRCDAVATSINNEGYLGTGSTLMSFYNDWWQYDPPTDHWTQKANLPGIFGRAGANAFSIGQYGFITAGSVWNTTNWANDLWQYDPANDLWVQKANLPLGRQYGSGFNYGSYGAVTCGMGASGYLNDFWYYDLNTDTWHSGTSTGQIARDKAVGFAVNGIPYVGTGETANNSYNRDFLYLTYVPIF